MKNEHRVLTPEGVEFVYELGGLGSRMAAVTVDHLLCFALSLGIWFVVVIAGCSIGIIGLLGAPFAFAVGRIAVFLVDFAYFVYFEWRWNGQTPGKRLFDLRVIDDRGMNADLFQIVIRNLFRAVDMAPFLELPGLITMAMEALGFGSVGLYGVAGLAALISPRQKRLGDWAAGTLVVRTRKQVIPSAIIAPNERYNTLLEDVGLRSRVRARLSLEERETLLQLCLRRNELEIESRQVLFSEAAEYLEKRLDIERVAFLSEEKFVQNITAVCLAESDAFAARKDEAPVR